MKNFLKRANRGLIVGTIVLLGFVVFIIADTVNFKKNKPQIEAAITAYTDAIAECAVTSSSKEEFQKKAEDLVSNYWSSNNNSGNTNNYYGLNISGYRTQLDTVAEENYTDDNKNLVTKWSANPYDFNITKSGSGFASVTFSCEIVAETQGNPYLITPADVRKISDFIYYEDQYEVSDAPSKFSVMINYEVKVRETGGRWKVCQAESWGWNEPSITTLDKTEGGDD